MEWLDVIRSILGFGLDAISLLFRLMLFAIVQIVMSLKNRNGFLWGLLVLFYPWTFLLMFWIPKKMPRLGAVYRQMDAFKGLNPVVSSIMALSAMLAKQDGQVTRDEILMVKQFVAQQFRLTATDLSRYQGAFAYGKTHLEEYAEFTRVLREYYRNRMTLMGFAYLLIRLSQADGMFSAKETLLRQIILSLGISQMEYASMHDSFGAYGKQSGTHGYRWQSGYADHNGQTYGLNRTAEYARLLGVSPDASPQEIKSAYRKIVKEFHPDKVASKGMPKEYVEYANGRVKEANEAYEYLMKQKGA